MNIIISVITAVYNDELYVKKSVESILSQTFEDFEYIIVDDGSSDNTLLILEEIAKLDKRVTIHSQENMGPAAARNKALSLAKGIYIALQDSDDISMPNRLQLQLEQLLNSGEKKISCTSYSIIDKDDHIITKVNKIYPNINNNILKGSFCVCHPSIMVSKELIINAGGYNTFYKKTEDYDLIFRLLENNAYFEKINICLYNYRFRENSESSMNNGAYAKRVYENHLNRIRKTPEDYSEVLNNFKFDRNYIFKRQIAAVFYSEEYLLYIKLYMKNFYKLPIRDYFPFFLFSVLPPKIKKFIKSLRFEL